MTMNVEVKERVLRDLEKIVGGENVTASRPGAASSLT
jgi:hypothetical protein